MKRKKRLYFLAWIPGLLVAALLLISEWHDLPHRLFGAPATPFNSAEFLFIAGFLFLLAIAGSVAVWYYQRWCQKKEQGYDARLTQLRKILDKSPILTVILGPDGAIHYANDAFLFHMGMTLAEVENRLVVDLLPIEDAAYLEAKLPQLVNGDINRIDLETVLITAQQRKIVLKGILILLDPGREGHNDILVFAEDITDRRSLEAKARGVPAIEELERITRDMAHEYNNKLMTILGAASLITDHSVSEEVALLMDKIRKTAEQSIDLTRRLAAFSGRREGTPLPHRLNRMTGSLLPVLRSSLPGSLRIRTEYCPEDPLLHCRTSLMQTALLNLAFNARDAMDHEGEILIATSFRKLTERTLFPFGELPPGEYAGISVSDTGCGIPGEEIAKIFQPFYTTRSNSAGLGLSSVAGAVKAHNGAVEVVTKPGSGSCFTLLFPLEQEDSEPYTETAPGTRPGTGRILLVDDEELLRSVMSGMINRLGYQVTEAGSGAEALLLWETEGPFDGILLDMVMPGMDGLMAARKFLDKDPSIRIMILTGYQVEERADDFAKAGITLAASKPINRKDLADKLACLVGK